MAIDFDNVDQCGKCGYDMTGLPARGTCPECGNAYDTQTRKGMADDPTTPRARAWYARHARTIVIVAMAAFSFTCCAGIAPIASNAERATATGTFIALMLMLAALASFFAERAEDRGH